MTLSPRSRPGSATGSTSTPRMRDAGCSSSISPGAGEGFGGALGGEAEPTPPSDNRTRELGARYTSGDECYPAKVTVGDFMKVVENPAIDNRRIALFMPTALAVGFSMIASYLLSSTLVPVLSAWWMSGRRAHDAVYGPGCCSGALRTERMRTDRKRTLPARRSQPPREIPACRRP